MNNFINKTDKPFTIITNDILQQKTVFKNANQKLCYLYLYSLKNFQKVFPSHETISQSVCCSISTVKRTLKDLENLGLLEIQRRTGNTNLYILHDIVQNELAQNNLDQIETWVDQNELGHLDQIELGRAGQNEPGVDQNELLKGINKNTKYKSNIIKNNNNKVSSLTNYHYNRKEVDRPKMVDWLNNPEILNSLLNKK